MECSSSFILAWDVKKVSGRIGQFVVDWTISYEISIKPKAELGFRDVDGSNYRKIRFSY